MIRFSSPSPLREKVGLCEMHFSFDIRRDDIANEGTYFAWHCSWIYGSHNVVWQIIKWLCRYPLIQKKNILVVKRTTSSYIDRKLYKLRSPASIVYLLPYSRSWLEAANDERRTRGPTYFMQNCKDLLANEKWSMERVKTHCIKKLQIKPTLGLFFTAHSVPFSQPGTWLSLYLNWVDLFLNNANYTELHWILIDDIL